MQPLDLGDPALGRLILRAALPAVGGLSINAAHQGVDALFIGQLGAEALAAVSLALPLAGVTAALGVGLGVGCATAIGRRLGAGDQAAAERIASLAMALCMGLAVVLALLLWAGHRALPELLGARGGVIAPAQAYLAVMALSAGLGMVQILCDFTAIGEGNARFSMMTLFLCFGLNIVLDPLLIFGLGLGVPGAALATVLAQLVTLAVYVRYFARGAGRLRLRLHLPLGRAALTELWPVLRIGLPETGALLVATAASLLLYRMAAGLAGAEGLAALGIVLRLLVLATLPIEGFCLGAQAVLAHAAGAGNPARLARAAGIVAAIACGAAVAAMAVALWAAQPLIAAFSADPVVHALAVPALWLLAPAFPAIALRLVAQITLQATERARLAAVLGLAPMGWLLLPLLAVLPAHWGFSGLAASLCLAAFGAGLGAAVILWRLLRPRNEGVFA